MHKPQVFIYQKIMELKTYTKNQLALRNGQDKPEIWVAFQGLIYDVTKSRLWKNGKHYEHWAGQDLTEELEDAPHSEKVFEKFEVVGKLT
jgi:predicted heme/steroid binding protein